MAAPDRLSMFRWMTVYYRQLARDGGDFLEKNPTEQWALLRAHIMADSPRNDPVRAEAIDGVQNSERASVLAWLREKSS